MITISESAANKIKEMLIEAEEGTQKMFLRVGVKGGGCSGLSYGMGFDPEVQETDTKLQLQGLDIIVDKDSAPLLQGVKIDFKENMMGGGFTIDNPNAVSTCGCGSSFRTEENAGSPKECD